MERGAEKTSFSYDCPIESSPRGQRKVSMKRSVALGDFLQKAGGVCFATTALHETVSH
jgi:hypothetical protein